MENRTQQKLIDLCLFSVIVSVGLRVKVGVGFRVRVRVGFGVRVSLVCNNNYSCKPQKTDGQKDGRIHL